MSSPYADGVVKRLNFGIDAPSPLIASRRGLGVGARSSRTQTPSTPHGHTKSPVKSKVVRYGLPEDELLSSDRHSGTRSVSYRIPSDDESSSEDDVTSAAVITRADPVDEQRRLLERQLLASLETIHHNKQASWRTRLAEVEAQLSAQLNVVTASAVRKQDDLQREDQELLRRQQQKRHEVLERLQRTHRTEASLQEQQIKQLVEQREEERRKEEERRRREEEEQRRKDQERLEAERERKRKEEEEQKEKERRTKEDEERKRQEAEAEKQRQEAKQKAEKAAKPPAHQAHPCLRVSAAAQQQATELAARLAELQAAVKPLVEDEAQKKQRRDIEKKLTVHVQQICGTQNQVQLKCQDVYNLLSGLQGNWRSYAVLTLCDKVIKQHELVQLNNKAAFPLALVVVKVSQYFPELLDIMVALIHKACPLAIPRGYVHDPERITNNAYYRGMGFLELEDPSAPSGKAFESHDNYVRRLEGVMLLYGAVMQVDEPNRHGVQHAWMYLARALNHLPPDRYTAKALIAVLRVAGYSLHIRFRGQFVKLLGTMQREFLPALRAASGDEIGALATLLDSYVTDGLYRKPPEGRDMPVFDISSRAENRA